MKKSNKDLRIFIPASKLNSAIKVEPTIEAIEPAKYIAEFDSSKFLQDLSAELKKSCPPQGEPFVDYSQTLGWNKSLIAVVAGLEKHIPGFNAQKFMKDCGYI